LDEPAALLQNQSARRGNFVGVELIGVRSNRSGLNARVIGEVNGRRLLREIVGGGSYLSDSDRRIVIGIGAAAGLDRLEIHWPSGQIDRRERLPAGNYTVFVEGRQ
jgi:hypothetical protein